MTARTIARFRVKKKQREHALEDTVSELTTKIDKLEKNLEASRVENNFLCDLVIRKGRRLLVSFVACSSVN